MGKKILLHWTRLLVLVMTIGLSGMISQESWGQATVKTDREDYQPGDYVKITGSGWQPGETVSFHFEEDPKPTTCVNPHDLVAIADENGNIYNDQFLIRENHLGVTFTLTAAGQSSGLVATTVFTDALLFSATISPVSICANTVQTYSLVVTNNTTNTGGTTGNNARLGSIRIFIPTGFSSVSSISSSLPFRFSASLVSGNIEIVRTGGASNSLAPGESITITFQATSPASAGAYEFTTEAWVSNDFSPVKYPAIGSEQNPGIQPGVTVNPSTLITTSPNNSIVTYGSNPTFSVSATGSGTLTYAWEEFNGSWNPVANGVIYSGANTNTLTLTKPGTALSGRQYRVKVTGGCGTVTSSPATLTVNPLAASVTPDDNTKEYGSADPTLTGTLSGFLAGDNVTAV
ncbi:MAG: MBG domain-containing protein, partial [Algoriphagus aquaeductus]|uniref:MBG domain-containing protein n=1 Tax=Algoriphagus aquaeductus TaxID=475299 RepID=UPI00391C2611